MNKEGKSAVLPNTTSQEEQSEERPTIAEIAQAGNAELEKIFQESEFWRRFRGA